MESDSRRLVPAVRITDTCRGAAATASMTPRSERWRRPGPGGAAVRGAAHQLGSMIVRMFVLSHVCMFVRPSVRAPPGSDRVRESWSSDLDHDATGPALRWFFC